MTPAAFRKMTLSLDGVEERPHMDRRAFRTKRRIFVTLGEDARVNLMIQPAERREALLASFPEAFFPLGGWTRLGYLAVDLRRVEPGLLRELVVEAWEAARPKGSDRLDGVPSATRPLVAAARAAIRSAAPKGAEELPCRSARPRSPSMMWKLVRYAIAGEVVVTVGTFRTHASIFFARGAELDDPSGMLEGSGKRLRYVTLRRPADAKRPAVKALVRRAFALVER